jgi:hypothetical protein
MAKRPPNFDRGNFYLSGGMQFAKDLGSDWRITASQKLKEMKYFPLDITALDKAYDSAHGKPHFPSIQNGILKFKADMRRNFVETDLRLIDDNSDALIVYYDESARRGAGTVSECQHAFNSKIPIYLVYEADSYEKLTSEVSAWLIALTTKFFLSFDELFEYLDKLPHGILHKDKYGNHCVGNQYLCHLSGDVFTKKKSKFVSHVHPLYSQQSVDVVYDVYENQKDRYQFFMETLEQQTGNKFTRD